MKTITFLTLTTFLFLSLSSIGQEAERPLSIGEGKLITSDRDGELDCPANSIFSQSPVSSTNGYFSDEGTFGGSQNEFDLFYGLTEDITGITFWGTMYDGSDCYTPGPMDFEISFYQDNAGAIGSLVQTFVVTVTPSETGSLLVGTSLLRFDVTLPSSISLASGWVSTVKQNPGNAVCTFAWANTTTGDNSHAYNQYGGIYNYPDENLSFCLTGNPPVPISNWAIIIGIFLIGTFMIIRFRRRLA